MKFDWQTVLKLIATLVISGFVWTQDNQLAVLTLAAIVVVWLVKFIAARTGKQIGKAQLTGALLLIAVASAVLFQGFAIPALPQFDTDLIVYIESIFTWLGALLASGGELFAYATGLYNFLLADVLKRLEPTPALKPKK
jgi:hypothetical protein